MKTYERLENNFETILEISMFRKQMIPTYCKMTDKEIDKMITGKEKHIIHYIASSEYNDKPCKYYHHAILRKISKNNYALKDGVRLNSFPMTLVLLGKILQEIENPNFIQLADAMSIVNKASFHNNVIFLRYLKNTFPNGIYVPLSSYDIVIRPSDYTLYSIPEEDEIDADELSSLEESIKSEK